MQIKVVLGALAVFCCVSAAAETESSRQMVDLPQEVREAVEAYVQPTGKVVAVWNAPGGLYGLAIEVTQGQGIVAYVDAHGELLLTGAAVRLADQVNLAHLDREEFFPAPGPADMYDEALELPLVASDLAHSHPNPIIAVVDTQCQHCHAFARQIAARGLRHRVRWVVVGWQGPKSRLQAAAVLDGEAERGESESALWAILTGQHDGSPAAPPRAGATALAATEAWATRWAVEGTPTVLVPFRGQIHRISGAPSAQLLDQLADTH